MLQRVCESCTLQREGGVEGRKFGSKVENIRLTRLLLIFVLIITIEIFPLLLKKRKKNI